jgi:hypothetical protein
MGVIQARGISRPIPVARKQRERALLRADEGRPRATSEFQSIGKVILTTSPFPTGGEPKPQLET